jgi:acetolactate decarboxylase
MKQILIPTLALLLTSCTTAPKNTLMQVSTIDALLAGIYDGQVPIRTLLKHGNTGLGTFNALDGEMIIIDRTVYQARTDGTVRVIPPEITTPFAAVVEFEADQTGLLNKPMGQETLKAHIDEKAPNKNLFLAIRIDGTFPTMKVRSVPKQKKPYPPLAEVAKHQTVFNYTNVTGTVIGFRCPTFVKGLNVPNYHLHFISDNRQHGGHILDFTTESGTLQLDTCNRFTMVLTDREAFAGADLSKDRSHELEKVEK